jgi:hypothetical protein
MITIVIDNRLIFPFICQCNDLGLTWDIAESSDQLLTNGDRETPIEVEVDCEPEKSIKLYLLGCWVARADTFLQQTRNIHQYIPLNL